MKASTTQRYPVRSHSCLAEHLVSEIANQRLTLGQQRDFLAISQRVAETRFDRVAPLQVIVGGTNGKGTTVYLLQQFLNHMGYRVGTTTSPHLHSYLERIAINGETISEVACETAIQAVDEFTADLMLTYFDLTTLAALWHFKHAGVDVALIEVGLGGRLDCANVIDPDLSILTNVELDHQQVLGNSREEIALEKCPISRPGRTLLYGQEAMLEAVKHYAEEHSVHLMCAGREFGIDHNQTGWVSRHAPCFDTAKFPDQLRGAWESAILAMQAAVLLDNSIRLTELVAIDTRLPSGRAQLIEAFGRHWLLDVAHNLAGIKHVLSHLYQEKIRTCDVVFGCLRDKDYTGMLRELLDHQNSNTCRVRSLHCVDIDSPRGLRLSSVLKEPNTSVSTSHHSTTTEAIDHIRKRSFEQSGGITVICGSFTVVAEASEYLNGTSG